MTFTEQLKDFYKKHSVIAILLILLIAIFVLKYAFLFWFAVLPLLAILFVWKKPTMHKALKIKLTIGIAIIGALLTSLIVYSQRNPVIANLIPQNNSSIQASQVVIQGTVSPSKAVVTVDGSPTVQTNNGAFTYTFPLNSEKNTITVTASNDDKTSNTTLTVIRLYTDQEKAQMAQQQAEDAKATALAQGAYFKTPAGKVCKAHPEWSKDDCEKIANKEVWIGENVKQLVYERGKPDSLNTSNYGTGDQYQACWWGYNPSCVYDTDNDGLVDSYN